jgi:alpha-glucan, water dikinase
MTQWTGYPSLFRFKNNDQNFQIHLRKTNIHQGQHSATTETRRHSSAERIVRKNRDVMQLLSKPATSHVTGVEEASPKSPTVLDLLLKSLQDKNYCEVLCKKFFKLGEKEILVSF